MKFCDIVVYDQPRQDIDETNFLKARKDSNKPNMFDDAESIEHLRSVLRDVIPSDADSLVRTALDST